ncbi:MAG: hypothetical protein AB8H12_24270 [Lewinella sp.]
MKYAILFIAIVLTLGPLTGQNLNLAGILDQVKEELTDVETEKYRYEQSLEYDAEKPWRITINIDEVNLKNDKSVAQSFYLNLADIDQKLINIETDKEEQLVVMKCRKRQDFIRLTEDDGDLRYESELQMWSPEIDKATALRDLFRQAAELGEAAWKADFSPGTGMEELNEWLEENVVSVDIGGESTAIEWEPDAELSDVVALTITSDDGEDVTVFKFSLADLSSSNLKLGVKRETVSVTVGTVNKANLVREENEGSLSGYENSMTIPVIGIEEAGRVIQVLEAAIPLARKVREARLPSPESLEGALQELSALVTGTQREKTNIEATLSTTPLATLALKITDIAKGDEKSERYLFDFGDLNAKKVNLRVRGVTLAVVVDVINGKDFVQQWKDEEEAGFDDEVAFPVNTIETSHKLLALLPYIIEQAGKIPVPVGDFAMIQEVVREASTEDVTQGIEQRDDRCKWSFRQVEEGKKVEEMLYEFNLYDLDPKKISYNVTSKGVFLELLTLRKEETINVYKNDEPSFTNEMVLRVNSLAAAKQLRVSVIKLVEGCVE